MNYLVAFACLYANVAVPGEWATPSRRVAGLCYSTVGPVRPMLTMGIVGANGEVIVCEHGFCPSDPCVSGNCNKALEAR